jgi:RHS repeat-associated protein
LIRSAQGYTFDQENRITALSGYTYTYDGDGNRVMKSTTATPSTGTLYWYMTPGIVAESDLSGAIKSEYVFFDGERVARKDSGSAVSYYFSDQLKTAAVETDASGNIKDESDFYPWGGELQFANSNDNHYKFTGKERDLESGLDYFGARYYGNALGRFMTPDWAAKATAVPYADFADPQSLDLYTYVRNIPTARIDVDGHLPKTSDIDWKKIVDVLADTAKSILQSWGTHPPHIPIAAPVPSGTCICPTPPKQNNQQNNQSNRSSTENTSGQGRGEALTTQNATPMYLRHNNLTRQRKLQ